MDNCLPLIASLTRGLADITNSAVVTLITDQSVSTNGAQQYRL